MVAGASPVQILRRGAADRPPGAGDRSRSGPSCNIWGNFLVPFILLRTSNKQPAAVVMYTFYTEGGQPTWAASRRSPCCTRSRW